MSPLPSRSLEAFNVEDGIMSALDFDMTMERQPDQKGDRVKIAMSGKFLGYKTY
jgi:cyanate lyase